MNTSEEKQQPCLEWKLIEPGVYKAYIEDFELSVCVETPDVYKWTLVEEYGVKTYGYRWSVEDAQIDAEEALVLHLTKYIRVCRSMMILDRILAALESKDAQH